MSIPAINWAIAQSGLPPAEWVVLFHLCHAHNLEYGCFPSQEFLADQTGLSRRTIVRQMAALEGRGLIVRIKRFKASGDRNSDRYKFPFEPDFPPSAKLTTGQTVHDQVPNGAQNVHELAPKQELTVNKQESKEKNTKKEISDLFDRIWERYPRKVSKGGSRSAFIKAVRVFSVDEIVPPLLRFCDLQNGSDKKFIPHLSTWLNEERWGDVQEDTVSRAESGSDQMNRLLGNPETADDKIKSLFSNGGDVNELRRPN